MFTSVFLSETLPVSDTERLTSSHTFLEIILLLI